MSDEKKYRIDIKVKKSVRDKFNSISKGKKITQAEVFENIIENLDLELKLYQSIDYIQSRENTLHQMADVFRSLSSENEKLFEIIKSMQNEIDSLKEIVKLNNVESNQSDLIDIKKMLLSIANSIEERAIKSNTNQNESNEPVNSILGGLSLGNVNKNRGSAEQRAREVEEKRLKKGF